MRIAIVIVSIALAACVDRGACLHSETSTYLQPMQIGSQMYLMPMTSSECVEWEYPDGKPEGVK